MKCKPVAKTSVKIGDKTVLGNVTAIELSPSKKTIVITVRNDAGREFTDRISAVGNMMIFTG